MNEAHRPSPLAARELGLRIPGGRWLLRGLTWQAARGGGILGVVGPNGAGKTTLLRSLVGLAKPPLGGVDLGGVAIERTTARQRARQLAYLPQGHSTPYDLPVEEVVMLGRAPHRRWFAAPSPSDARAVRDALVACEVESFAARGIRSLSGGERQRVMLARMLATQTQVLVLDEPTTGLDIGHALRICGLLRALADDGHCIVVALHELELARRLCDEVLLLRGDADGTHISGPASEILTPAHLDPVFAVRTRILEGALIIEATAAPSTRRHSP